MTMHTFTTTIKMVTQECCTCHVLFAMTDEMNDERLRDHRSFYCPNGHSQSYTGKSAEQKLREKLTAEQERIVRLNSRLDQERAAAEHERNRANGYKGALTKTKKRVANGACPNCNRHFPNLEAHMKTKHPEYAS
jgi:hypothetical protein